MTAPATRLLLAGGGHAHIEVLRRFALRPPDGVELALVSTSDAMLYSGMTPAVIAGHFTLAEAQIALRPLAASARARFVTDTVVALDLAARVATCASGRRETFDVLSLDVGSVPDRSLPGASEFAVGVRPLDALVNAWEVLRRDALADRIGRIAIVGGGAAGAELCLAMQYALQAACGPRAPRMVLVSDHPRLLPGHARGAQRRIESVVSARAEMHLGCAASAIERSGVRLADGRSVEADRVIVATGAQAPPWLVAAGLACDAHGFVRIDASLRSSSHPFVFAAGDCATSEDAPRPKSGVYAVRAGPPLAENLRRSALDRPLVMYRPQRRALALIGTGDACAIASWPPLAAAGRWVFRWKSGIDRRFVARYRTDH